MTQILLYTSPALGGILQYNHAIVSALATLGYQITYVQEIPDDLVRLFGSGGVARAQQRAGWFVQRQPTGIQHQWLEAPTASRIDQVIAEAAPDLVICSNGAPIANFHVKRTALRLGIPFVVVEHLVHPVKPQAPPQAFAELVEHYRAATAVIAVSEDNLRLLRQLFGLAEDKGKVIYCGRPSQYFQPIDLETRSRLRQQWQIPETAVVCFTAARLDIVKGYQYQVAAIKQLKQTPAWDALYFVWAGTGTLQDSLRQMVQRAGVDDRVKFLGELDAIDEWLDASDIFILPSESEGLPLALMEAMAKGLPAIATAVSGIPEGLGDTGKLLTSPIFGDSRATIQELVTTLQSWTVDPDLRREIGNACKRRAEQLFREERMVAETIDVIQSALGSTH